MSTDAQQELAARQVTLRTHAIHLPAPTAWPLLMARGTDAARSLRW